MCPPPESVGQSGAVNISGHVGNVHGDIVGGNKYGPTAEEIVAVLEAKGVIRTAETAGLERQAIVKIAQRLKPDVLDFDQAVRELKHAVTVALDVIARGERGANRDDFVNAVLAHVAEKTRVGDFDGGASTIASGLAGAKSAGATSQVLEPVGTLRLSKFANDWVQGGQMN